jgi:prepilin-type N-terminal cleavage/methylation domain-containing protein
MPETRPSHSIKYLTQQGFTLLELVLVLFLIGLLASAGLLFTENIESQAKYEETQKRIALIKRAIVGDLTRTVNGGPELSGFVADVGRLPLCIKELIELGEQVGATDDFESPCETDSEFYLKLWQVDGITGVGAGWRGPYIQAVVESDGERRFRDGYGNGNDSDDLNFGWRWQLAKGMSDVDLSSPSSAVNVNRIQLQSDGFDISLVEDDVPGNGSGFLIGDDWLYPDGEASEAAIRVDFRLDDALSKTPVSIEAALVRPEVNGNFLSMPLSAATAISLSSSGVTAYSEVFEFNQALPMGRYSFRLSCSASGVPTASCVPANYLLTILPRQTLAPLEFRIIP